MNQLRFFLISIAVALFQTGSSAAVKILSIKGENASFSVNQGRTFKKLKPTSTIKEVALIKTGDGSQVDLQLEDAVLVRVTQNSQLGIDKSETEGEDHEVKLDCREGRIVCASQTLSLKSKFEIKIPAGVCGARGETPEFDANSQDEFRCVSGNVVVVYAYSGPVMPALKLGSGEGAVHPNSQQFNYRENKAKLAQQKLTELSEEISDLKKSLENRSHSKNMPQNAKQ